MPAAFLSLSSPAKSPDSMRARCGYVWLPIGRPSGFARSFVPVAPRKPATATLAAVVWKNSRRVMTAIVLSSRLLAGAGFVKPDVGDRPVGRVLDGVRLCDAYELRANRRERDRRVRSGSLSFSD